MSKAWQLLVYLLILQCLVSFAVIVALALQNMFRKYLRAASCYILWKVVALGTPTVLCLGMVLAPWVKSGKQSEFIQRITPEVYLNNVSAHMSLPTPISQTQTIDICTLFLVIWLAGILAVGLCSFFQARRFFRCLSTAQKVSHSETIRLLSELKMTLRMQNKILLASCKEICTPLSICIGQGIILLPFPPYSLSQMHHILLHELIHIKRKDSWIKGCAILVVALGWFNPFVYCLLRQMNLSCELSCDEAVLSTLTKDQHQAYGLTLLEIANKNSVATLYGIGFAQSAHYHILKERVELIKNSPKHYHRYIDRLAMLLLSFTLITCTIATAYASPVNISVVEPTSAQYTTLLQESLTNESVESNAETENKVLTDDSIITSTHVLTNYPFTVDKIKTYPASVALVSSDVAHVTAVVDGVVTKTVDMTNENLPQGGHFGSCVTVTDKQGNSYLYGSLSQLNVTVGEKVIVGDTLGISGQTGFAEYANQCLFMARNANGDFITFECYPDYAPADLK